MELAKGPMTSQSETRHRSPHSHRSASRAGKEAANPSDTPVPSLRPARSLSVPAAEGVRLGRSLPAFSLWQPASPGVHAQSAAWNKVLSIDLVPQTATERRCHSPKSPSGLPDPLSRTGPPNLQGILPIHSSAQSLPPPPKARVDLQRQTPTCS